MFPPKTGVDKRLVPIQFGGINTKADPKQLQAGQLLTLQNGQFSKIGQINKRYGYDTYNVTITNGEDLSSGVELATYKDEQILFDGNNIYSYLPSTGNWSNRGTAISVTEQDANILRLSAAEQVNPDMATLNGVQVFCWEDNRNGIRYSVIDSETKAFIISDTQVNSVGQQPKVIAFQNEIFIFYSDGVSGLYYQTISPLNPGVITPQQRVVSDGFVGVIGTFGFPYDCAVIGNQLFIAYLSGSKPTGAIVVFYINSGFFQSATVVVNDIVGQPITTGIHGAINVVGDSGNNVWISWANGLSLYTSLYSLPLNQLLGTTLIDNGNFVVITGIESPTPLTLLLCYESLHTPSWNEQTRFTTISPTGTIGTISTIRSVGLASKAFTYNNNIYVNCAYESNLQATDFTVALAIDGGLLSITPLNPVIIVAKETQGVGGGLQTNGMCPETNILSPGVFIFANLQSGKIVSDFNALFTVLGVCSSQLTFTPSDNFVNTVQSNTLLIVGGILQGYDGNSTTELGFHLFPENITVTSPNGALGNLSAGTYQYIVEFQWTDNNGQIYCSAPSVPISITLENAGQSVLLTGSTLRLTSKLTPISIVISRTVANGTVFVPVTSVVNPFLNSYSTDGWIYSDIVSDANIASSPPDYTTGNVLANIAPPANSIIATYNNRVFLSGMSDPLLMWYSQSVVDNSNFNTIPPQFCQELTMTVDPRGGAITALSVLNQTLIIFKETHIFGVQGNGPDATGANSDYGDPTLITSDVGCINDNSVVIMPQGLMFQSAKGIYLLDQSLNLTYIGAPVEAFNNSNITSSTLSANTNQVIFTTSSGVSLVYDYYMQQWSTWTNQFAVDGAIFNGNFAYLTANGQVFIQNQNVFTDGSSPIYLSFTTPNLSFAGIQGYQRVFRCFILGTYKGPHTLNVSVAYDYNDSYTQFATVTPNTATTWGGPSTPNWGLPDGGAWGGEYQLYEYRIDFKIQKCTAIRLQITDNQSSAYNEGYAISSIVFEVGVMPGGNKLPTTSTYGTT